MTFEPTPEPATEEARRAAAAARARARRGAPGLGEQVRATRDAVAALVRAHIDLAKAELNEIKGEILRAIALGGAAFTALTLAGLLLGIGMFLWLGEWLFGSMGWGILQGTLFYTAVAVAAVLLALRVSGVWRSLLLGVIVGVVIAVILGPSLPNRLWTAIGDATALAIDPAYRPVVIGAVTLGILGALAGVALGAGAGAAGPGFIVGLVFGALLGAFSAITFGWQVGIALGVSAGLTAWIGFMGAAVARGGIDGEALKARFWPDTTINTTKETIEWAKAQTPLGPKS